MPLLLAYPTHCLSLQWQPEMRQSNVFLLLDDAVRVLKIKMWLWLHYAKNPESVLVQLWRGPRVPLHCSRSALAGL